MSVSSSEALPPTLGLTRIFRPLILNLLEAFTSTLFSLSSASVTLFPTVLFSPILFLGWTLNLPLDLILFLVVSSEDDGGVEVVEVVLDELEVSGLSEELGSVTRAASSSLLVVSD